MRKIVVVPEAARPWVNVELTKCCGIVPYLLGRNHGAEVTFIGMADPEEYTYTELLKGARFEKLQNCETESKIEYIQKNAKDIDLLVLSGFTYDNIVVTKEYKKHNPEGLVFDALDMNSEYADRIPFYEDFYRGFFDNVDVMSGSCQKIVDFLNEKWYWPVECYRNGYYNAAKGSSDIAPVPFENRENIILYVGRINNGIKQSDRLIEAFAKAIPEIDNQWKLRLVGEFEEGRKEIEETVSSFPQLAGRIEFAGHITDRDELHKEYERAKIFATMSKMEGGTPNALAEAICTGLVMAVTEFDAYEDITGGGVSGMSVPIGDVNAFTGMLVKLCNESALEKMSEISYSRGQRFYNMEKIVGELYGKLCDKGF